MDKIHGAAVAIIAASALTSCSGIETTEGEAAEGSASPSTAGTPPRPSPPSPPASASVTGDCNAQGSNNNVHCITQLPTEFESLAGISLDWMGDGGSATVLFAGPPEELPDPPSYENPWNHCDEWEEWFGELPEIYRFNSDTLVSVISGQPDVVAIRDVHVEVFSRTERPDESTVIQCAYGAGGDHGNIISVDLSTGDTTLEMLDSGDVSPMPPASLSLSGMDYESALVAIDSTNGYLYEGMITIEAVVNGEDHTFQHGSEAQPLRWVGGGLDSIAQNEYGGVRYDWAPDDDAWVDDFAPMDR